jgi:hypothetical protein
MNPYLAVTLTIILTALLQFVVVIPLAKRVTRRNSGQPDFKAALKEANERRR